MTAQGQCPSCMAPLLFRGAQSHTLVCEYCQTIVARGDSSLEMIGKTNHIYVTSSSLALWTEGFYQNQRYTLMGRTQLQHEKGGTWDEWYGEFGNGKAFWIAEHQGRLWLTHEVDAGEFTARTTTLQSFKIGQRLLTGFGEFTVAEKGIATIVSESGELPQRSRTGSKRAYVDFSSRDKRVATLDLGTIDDENEQESVRLFIGRAVSWDDIGLKIDAASIQAPSVSNNQALQCPHCTSTLKKPLSTTETLTCPSCQSILHVGQGSSLDLIQAEQRLRFTPRLPWKNDLAFSEEMLLTSKHIATLKKIHDPTFSFAGLYACIAYVVRSIRIDGETYYYEEYLLHSVQAGYIWLVYSDEEWWLSHTLETGQVTASFQSALCGDIRFSKNSGPNEAVVEQVIGELYFRLRVNDVVQSTDYIHSDMLLAQEEDHQELNWSIAFKVPTHKIHSLFGISSTPSNLEVSQNDIKKPLTWLEYFIIIIFFAAFAAAIFAESCDSDCYDENGNYVCGSTSRGGVSGGSFGFGK